MRAGLCAGLRRELLRELPGVPRAERDPQRCHRTPITYVTGTSPYMIASVDFNLDGLLDLLRGDHVAPEHHRL